MKHTMTKFVDRKTHTQTIKRKQRTNLTTPIQIASYVEQKISTPEQKKIDDPMKRKKKRTVLYERTWMMQEEEKK